MMNNTFSFLKRRGIGVKFSLVILLKYFARGESLSAISVSFGYKFNCLMNISNSSKIVVCR